MMLIEKRCTACEERKPVSDFTKRVASPDGLAYKCKSCEYERTAEWYQKNRDQVAAYQIKYAAKNRDRRRAYQRKYMREWRKNNQQIQKARNDVNNAVQAGRLARLPCEVCGEPKTQGHHDDYIKTLDVRWLCFEHHLEVHGKILRSGVAP